MLLEALPVGWCCVKRKKPPSHLLKDPTYRSWLCMRTRCYNPRRAGWKDYGGRGIRCDSRWDSFKQFVEDMGPRLPGTSLDRIDVDGDYEPSNCRWATSKQQANNTRTNVWVEVEGQLDTLTSHCSRYGVHICTVRSRVLKKGWTFERAILTPPTRGATRGQRRSHV